jgi:membrane protease YdiL (CAAX protease family)
MRTAITSEPQQKNLRIGKLIWAMSLLVFTTWGLAGFGASFIWRAIRQHDSSYWPSFLIQWAFPVAMTFIALELIVVLYVYRPLRDIFKVTSGGRPERSNGTNVVIGVASGACAFIVSVPILLITNSDQSTLREISSCPICLGVILQLSLLLIVLPVLSELVFRGVVFKTLEAQSSLWPAAIASSLLFACVWPVLNSAVAIVLGVASALVFHKTRAIISCIFTNASLTVLAETFLMLRRMHVV